MVYAFTPDLLVFEAVAQAYSLQRGSLNCSFTGHSAKGALLNTKLGFQGIRFSNLITIYQYCAM